MTAVRRGAWALLGLVAVLIWWATQGGGLPQLQPGDGAATPARPIDPATAPVVEPGRATSAERTAVDAQVTPSSAETGTACVKLRRAVIGSNEWSYYTGPCDVRDGAGAVVATLHGARQLHALTFALPRTATRAQFVCPGYRTIERDVPAMRDGVRDFGELMLVADAAVRARVVHVPSEWSGHVECAIEADDDDFGSTSLALQDGGGEVLLPAPSGRALQCRIESRDGSPFALGNLPVALQLQPGETRLVELDVAALPVQTIRVVGPSRALLPELRVRCATEAQRVGAVVRLDVDGRAVVRGGEVAKLHYTLIDGNMELLPHANASGRELELEPARPIVGIALRGDGGERVPFMLDREPGGGGLQWIRESTMVQVLEAAMVAPTQAWLAWSEATGSLRWTVGAIAWRGDLGELDVHTAERRCSLVVTADGERPKGARRFAVELLDGKDAVVAVRESVDDGAFSFADLLPGDYRVRWQIAGAAGPAIGGRVPLRGGPMTRLRTTWPVMVTWRGDVANWRAIAPADRLVLVCLGARRENGTALVDDAGHFQLQLPADAPPPSSLRFCRDMTLCEGRVLSVDALAHSLLVEHPTDLRWVDLRVTPLAAGAWVLMLHHGKEIAQVLRADTPQRVLLPAGGVLHGALLEDDPESGDRRVTAWVTIDGSVAEVPVSAVGGRWCTLRFENTEARLAYELLGPDDTLGWFGTMARPGTRRVWIARGTRTLLARLTSGGEQRFDVAADEIIVR